MSLLDLDTVASGFLSYIRVSQSSALGILHLPTNPVTI